MIIGYLDPWGYSPNPDSFHECPTVDGQNPALPIIRNIP